MEALIEMFNQNRFWILPVVAAGVAWLLACQLREMLGEAAALFRGRPVGERRASISAGGGAGRLAARTWAGMVPPEGAFRAPAGFGLSGGEDAPWIP